MRSCRESVDGGEQGSPGASAFSGLEEQEDPGGSPGIITLDELFPWPRRECCIGQWVSEPCRFVKTVTAPPSCGSGMAPKNCISSKLPGDAATAAVAGVETAL